MFLEYLTSALVTLLVTLDPPGLAPIFLSLTRGMTNDERRQVAIRACLIAFCIMAFFGLAGDLVLKAVAATLRGALQEGDHLARHGGEELVALVPGAGAAGRLAAGR